MDYVDLMDSVPSALSTVATIAAALAAWGSLKVSRESKHIAEQSALALHHGSASKALSDGLELVARESEELSSLALMLVASGLGILSAMIVGNWAALIRVPSGMCLRMGAKC